MPSKSRFWLGGDAWVSGGTIAQTYGPWGLHTGHRASEPIELNAQRAGKSAKTIANNAIVPVFALSYRYRYYAGVQLNPCLSRTLLGSNDPVKAVELL